MKEIYQKAKNISKFFQLSKNFEKLKEFSNLKPEEKEWIKLIAERGFDSLVFFDLVQIQTMNLPADNLYLKDVNGNMVKKPVVVHDWRTTTTYNSNELNEMKTQYYHGIDAFSELAMIWGDLLFKSSIEQFFTKIRFNSADIGEVTFSDIDSFLKKKESNYVIVSNEFFEKVYLKRFPHAELKCRGYYHSQIDDTQFYIFHKNLLPLKAINDVFFGNKEGCVFGLYQLCVPTDLYEKNEKTLINRMAIEYEMEHFKKAKFHFCLGCEYCIHEKI